MAATVQNEGAMARYTETDDEQPLMSSERRQQYTTDFHNDLVANSNHSLINIAALSGCFFLLFASYSALQNVAGVIVGSQDESNWGLVVIGAVYVALTLMSMVAPAIIQKTGEKWGIVFSTLGYAGFMGAYFYPKTWVLIPMGLVCGSAASCLWAAQGAYLTRIAHTRARALKKDVKESVALYNSIFWGLFASTQIIGNGISYVVFSSGDDKPTTSDRSRTDYILFTFYVGSALLGALLMAFAKNDKQMKTMIDVDEDGQEVPPVEPRSVKESIVANAMLVKNRGVVQLIPLMIFSGVQEPYVWSWMTTKVVEDKQNINLFMIVYGVFSLVSSVTFGKLGTTLSRALVFISIAATMEAAVAVYMIFLGYPRIHSDFFNDEDHVCLNGCWFWYVAFAVFGMGDGTLNTQISNTISILHDDISIDVYAHWKVWQSLAIALLYFLNGSVHNGVDGINTNLIYINSALLFTTMVGGLIGYTRLVRRSKGDMHLPRSLRVNAEHKGRETIDE